MSVSHSSSNPSMAQLPSAGRPAVGDSSMSYTTRTTQDNSNRGRDYSKQNDRRMCTPSNASDASSRSHRLTRETNRKISESKHKKPTQTSEWPWPGRSPDRADLQTWQSLRETHKTAHTLEDAAMSVHRVFKFLQELDGKGAILDMNGMRIALEHIFMKSACFCASSVCFEAASFAVHMMEKQSCGFPSDFVTEIVKAISLRADLVSKVVPFVNKLANNTLRHLTDNERRFFARMMVFALAERDQEFQEFLNGSDTRSVRGLEMDWAGSSEQKFVLFNRSEGDTKWYDANMDEAFVNRGSVYLLSFDLRDDDRVGFGHQYSRRLDGAIVEIHSVIEKRPLDKEAKEKKPLEVRLRTPVTVPFKEGARYRIDEIGINNNGVNKLMEALSVLARDSIEVAKAKAAPHPHLLNMIMLPPEEPFSAHIVLQPKVSALEDELELVEDEHPIRVKAIGSGALFAWNQANPQKPIRVGDRIAKMNDAEDKAGILEELRHAHEWTQYSLNITFMRVVNMKDHGIQDEMLQRMSQKKHSKEPEETTQEIFQRERSELQKRLHQNQSQVDAVEVAATRRVALIQGPPGSGKTSTAVEIVMFLLDHDIVPPPILVTGHTNTSVDNLVVPLASRGKRVVRLAGDGSLSKVREDCRAFLPDGEKGCELEEAEVICATCSSSGSGKLQQKGIYCHTVLLDEGSQATESSCLVPLCHGAQHLIIVGDQCQLEPMVKSDYAKAQGLGGSLFNRLYKQGVVPTMLNVQFRMHPFICEFPSAAFYGSRLLSGVSHSDRTPSSFWAWPSSRHPVCFVDIIDGVEDSSGDKIVNQKEALCVKKAVNQLLMDPKMKILVHGTYPIAVVTGYAAQKALIEELLIESGLVDAEGKCLVEVNTVDSFQGREKAVIIFSAVRANHESVGFLRDWRRLNVMLTRAQNGLIIFGHRVTLQSDHYWNNWLRWASSNGCIMGEDAKGKWTPKCLLPDEWAMSTKDSEAKANTSSAQEASSIHPAASMGKTLEHRTDTTITCDSWDDSLIDSMTTCDSCYSLMGFSESSSRSQCDSDVAASWEDLQGDELEDDTSRGPLDKILQSSIWFSESSSHSQCDSEVAESWEDLQGDDLENDTSRGPLDKALQARMCESDVAESWENLQGNDLGDDTLHGPLDKMLQASICALEGPCMASTCELASGVKLPLLESIDFAHEEVIGVKDGLRREAGNVLANGDEHLHKNISPSPEELLTRAASSGEPSDFLRQCSMGQGLEHLTVTSHSIVNWQSESAVQEIVPTMFVPVLVPVSCFHSAFCGFPLANPVPNTCAPQQEMQCLKTTILRDRSNQGTILRTEWYADSQKLYGNDRSIVSPVIQIPSEMLRRNDRTMEFKLILSSKGNGFSKSQGVGHIKLRCEASLPNAAQGLFGFKIMLGTETHGHVAHDFYSRPTADMPGNPNCRFRRFVDVRSKKVLIQAELWSALECQ